MITKALTSPSPTAEHHRPIHLPQGPCEINTNANTNYNASSNAAATTTTTTSADYNMLIILIGADNGNDQRITRQLRLGGAANLRAKILDFRGFDSSII